MRNWRVLTFTDSLEHPLQRKLNHSGSNHGWAGNLAESRAVAHRLAGGCCAESARRIRIGEHRVIEKVEELRTKLKIGSFRGKLKFEVLGDSEIEVDFARARDVANGCVSKGRRQTIRPYDRRRREAISIEVIIDLVLHGAGFAECASRRVIGAIIRNTVGIARISQCRGQAMTVLHCGHTRNRPTAQRFARQRRKVGWMRKIIGITQHKPLRPDKSLRSKICLPGSELIAENAASKAASHDPSLRIGKVAGPGVRSQEIKTMAEMLVQARLQAVVEGFAPVFIQQQSCRVPAYVWNALGNVRLCVRT